MPNAWPRGTTPFTYDSRPYYRLESITKVMPREMFEARIRESQPHLYAWERQQTDGIKIEDLDDNLISGAVQSGVKGGRLSSSALSETKRKDHRYTQRRGIGNSIYSSKRSTY